MTFPGGPRKVILIWEKIRVARFRSFQGRRSPPEKITPSDFLRHLSDFQLFILFGALGKTEKTLLCVIEMRKGPFRVRRPGARIGLSLGETQGLRFRAGF